ncbi:hypothetical protein [Bartonella senegalensis]|uniref:hypothetical protein n=1 Tax=Bartonella senegalensis TaxID=1468418 RepID=UPI00030089AB|nr:hypothetical protein [Bartonella senegalensis]
MLSYSKSLIEAGQLDLEKNIFDTGIEKSTLNKIKNSFLCAFERALVLAQKVAKGKQFIDRLLEKMAVDLFLENIVESLSVFKARDPNLYHKNRAFYKKVVEEKR